MPKDKRLLVNKVKTWCAGQKLDRQDFLAKVLAAKLGDEGGKVLSVDTILRVYDGDTKISMATASLIAKSVGVQSIAELFDIE